RTNDGDAFDLHYANGPIFEVESVADLAPFVTLATFESELSSPEYGTQPGEMLGTPAIVAARYGRGRIVLFSPNPTLEPARSQLLVRALRWVSQRGQVPSNLRFADVFSR